MCQLLTASTLPQTPQRFLLLCSNPKTTLQLEKPAPAEPRQCLSANRRHLSNFSARGESLLGGVGGSTRRRRWFAGWLVGTSLVQLFAVCRVTARSSRLFVRNFEVDTPARFCWEPQPASVRRQEKPPDSDFDF